MKQTFIVLIIVLFSVQFNFSSEIELVALDMDENPVNTSNFDISENSRYVVFTSISILNAVID